MTPRRPFECERSSIRYCQAARLPHGTRNGNTSRSAAVAASHAARYRHIIIHLSCRRLSFPCCLFLLAAYECGCLTRSWKVSGFVEECYIRSLVCLVDCGSSNRASSFTVTLLQNPLSFIIMKFTTSIALAAIASTATAFPTNSFFKRASNSTGSSNTTVPSSTDGPVGYASQNGGYDSSLTKIHHITNLGTVPLVVPEARQQLSAHLLSSLLP